MEQEYITALYQTLGMSVGADFSTEDVSLLYSKVFHFPSNTTEAHAAMKKIAGGDSNWSCVGENVLDVLLEMEREREKKEILYWDLLLLSTGNPNPLFHMMDSLLQNIDLNTLKKTYNSDSGSLQQMGRWVGGKEVYGKKTCATRLKKATRQCWARLASGGVQSILPSKWQSQSQRIRSQAWGCASLSDVLLLVDVKYDVITDLLYTEMLQEHHTKSVWEKMLPWQQHQEVGRLEDHVAEALASFDMLSLAELSGAFRIYKVCLVASFRSCPDSMEQSWSAVSFLNELHTFRKQEQDALRILGKRMHGESLKLLCLYIRLATLRAQREKMSYSALLAARQSWETWPHVNSPCRAEQVALWLHGEEEEKEDNFKTVEQQSVLQLLVLTQEQERKHLVTLIRRISIKDLQAPVCTMPPKDDNHHQVALRNGCIKRLHEIHVWLQTHNGTQTPLEQTNPKPQPKPQPQVQAHSEWSQLLWEDCALLLLTHLMELQEVQASVLLQAMMDENAQRVQALRNKYESEIQAQCFTNLLHLLISDAPLTTGSMLNPYPNWIQNTSSKQITVQSSYNGQVQVQSISGGAAEAKMADSHKGPNNVVNEVQTVDGTYKQDVCSGCGAVMEELPYLEILCVSDAHKVLDAEGGAQEEEGSEIKIAQSYEKQGSLITLAWSKPPEDDTDNAAEAADGSTGQTEDAASILKTQIQPTQCDKSARERDGEELKPTVLQSGSSVHYDTQSANQQCSTVEQLTSSNRPAADQPNEGEAVFKRDLQTHALVAESQEATQPHPMADSSETNPQADDLCSGACNDITNAGRDVTEVETESEQWDLRGPEPALYEDQKYSTEVDCGLSECKAKKEPTLMERERVREPVSAMERERTMRNLVDMQRKVEQRQQRDRERQLLRVQERLSIIQNRKAEEDLLGLKHTDRIKHLTQDLPLEDKNQQKTVVKERLEQLRRERSYVMQSKRDRNTAGFKELLGPVALQSRETEDGED